MRSIASFASYISTSDFVNASDAADHRRLRRPALNFSMHSPMQSLGDKQHATQHPLLRFDGMRRKPIDARGVRHFHARFTALFEVAARLPAFGLKTVYHTMRFGMLFAACSKGEMRPTNNPDLFFCITSFGTHSSPVIHICVCGPKP